MFVDSPRVGRAEREAYERHPWEGQGIHGSFCDDGLDSDHNSRWKVQIRRFVQKGIWIVCICYGWCRHATSCPLFNLNTASWKRRTQMYSISNSLVIHVFFASRCLKSSKKSIRITKRNKSRCSLWFTTYFSHYLSSLYSLLVGQQGHGQILLLWTDQLQGRELAGSGPHFTKEILICLFFYCKFESIFNRPFPMDHNILCSFINNLVLFLTDQTKSFCFV